MRKCLLGKEAWGFKKNFETEMWVDNSKLPLNHFMQETLANMMIGIMKGLKELEEPPRTIELKNQKAG